MDLYFNLAEYEQAVEDLKISKVYDKTLMGADRLSLAHGRDSTQTGASSAAQTGPSNSARTGPSNSARTGGGSDSGLPGVSNSGSAVGEGTGQPDNSFSRRRWINLIFLFSYSLLNCDTLKGSVISCQAGCSAANCPC